MIAREASLGSLSSRRKSGSAAAAQGASRQHDDCPKEPQDSSNGYSHNAEGQQQQPYEGIQDQRQQRQRPADYQQDAPQQESRHCLLPFITMENPKKFPVPSCPHRKLVTFQRRNP
jgi:hypothetical protein